MGAGAIVLLSGGLDSAVTLACARAENFEPHALSFDYGQRHRIELAAARRVAQSMQVQDHRIAEIDLRLSGGPALTAEIDVPPARPAAGMASGIPVTSVRARDTPLLA